MNRCRSVLLLVATLSLAACGGSAMGYRWPEPREWRNREVPPRVLALDQGGYASKYTIATQYQVDECERIAAAYGERARHRDETGTLLTGAGGFLAGVGVVLVGGSQAVDQTSTAREPMLWTGVGAGVVGAALALWQTFSGTTQASAYNDAASHVRQSIDDFLSNIRSHDNVAGESLNASILSERLCSLREQCQRPEFGVAVLGTEFGDKAKEDEEAEQYLADLCDPLRVVVPHAAPPDGATAVPPAGPDGGR